VELGAGGAARPQGRGVRGVSSCGRVQGVGVAADGTGLPGSTRSGEKGKGRERGGEGVRRGGGGCMEGARAALGLGAAARLMGQELVRLVFFLFFYFFFSKFKIIF
jgi:hypothetical protein